MIIISREFAVSAAFNKHDVYLNNTYIGTLKTGGELAAHADVGTQRLFFKDRTFYGAENDAFFDVIINEDSQTVELFAYYNSPGEFVVTYATEPASPLYHTPSPPASVFRRRKTITCRTCGAQISPRAPWCPHCGEKPLGTALGDGLANFIMGLIFLPFWIILIAISIALYLGFFYNLNYERILENAKNYITFYHRVTYPFNVRLRPCGSRRNKRLPQRLFRG